MKSYQDRVFDREHIILDEGIFVRCTFKGCTFEYSGGNVFMEGCSNEGGILVMLDSALRTASLLPRFGLAIIPVPKAEKAAGEGGEEGRNPSIG